MSGPEKAAHLDAFTYRTSFYGLISATVLMTCKAILGILGLFVPKLSPLVGLSVDANWTLGILAFAGLVIGPLGLVIGPLGTYSAVKQWLPPLRIFFAYLVADMILSIFFFAEDMVGFCTKAKVHFGVHKFGEISDDPVSNLTRQCTHTRVYFTFLWGVVFAIGCLSAYLTRRGLVLLERRLVERLYDPDPEEKRGASPGGLWAQATETAVVENEGDSRSAGYGEGAEGNSAASVAAPVSGEVK
uniref:Uncharacterized protein n=1 Tax=Chromera velia CCMP2878 TaxID=1169474 RepID=A0A0K6S947_9ALVE|eukprot:Cvel_27712.t3-p1 / transcript=Cvel_27712.t3 / gene=Cvel_27712 / organism=Chromera_velia_CCMP2878 / gene_product=hypothetical protein / transcript_product=hypothetical protein / location=Cvel_scaffold3501:11648-15846(+) / protein_length=243 / sequence_SO=supercontig / SO=protein_coding / is_pseudo=false